MKNKKGSSEVILMVLLVVFLVFFFIGVSFSSSKRVETKIYDTKFLKEFYSKQDVAEVYIQKAGEDAVKNGKVGFKDNFKTEFAKYNFEEDYLNELKKIVSDGNFEVLEGENFLEVVIKDLEMKISKDIKVIYSPEISVKIYLGK